MFCLCNDLVRVVDVSTGTILRTLEGDTELAMCLALSPDDSVRPFGDHLTLPHCPMYGRYVEDKVSLQISAM